MVDSNLLAPNAWKFRDPACCFGFVILALVVGLHGLEHSGEQWLEDGPRSCNNGAMMHDWIVSGDWLNPVGCAKENYVIYPSHSVPYHPPGYALFLGAWFTMVGMSYATARVFVALCLGLTLCFFYGILRRQNLAPWMAVGATVLLATTPEIGQWSRTAMAEIPGMLFIMAGSYCFVRSVDSGSGRWCLLAFVLAEFAFFCRILTAGVLPAWFLFLLAKKGFRRVVTPNLIAPAILYLVIGATWAMFIRSLATYELVHHSTSDSYSCLSPENLLMWLQGLPRMVGWPTLAIATCGLILGFRDSKSRSFVLFWSFWFLSCYGLQIVQTVHFESRYFIYSVPSVCAAAAFLFTRLPSRVGRSLALLAVGVAIVGNIISISRMPQGLQGFDTVADQLASQEDTGNILISSWSDSDLVFRFRCHKQKQDRQIIRADRVLAIRAPIYVDVAPKVLAKTHDDVVDVIRRGRIRYVVTSASCQSAASGSDKREDEVILLHEAALAKPELFELLGRHTIIFDFGRRQRKTVCVWRFRGDLPEGKSELPVIIPTAGMTLKP